MRPRTSARLYYLASRVWLTAAGLSLLLPSSARRGIWLPLHLTLAGAVTVSISGAMQNFASALTATPAPPSAAVWAQFGLVNVGAALLAAGYPSAHPALVASGGALFLLAIALLGWFLWRAWSRGLNRRHRIPMAMYGAAVTSLLAGGTIGAFIGSGAVHDPSTWIALRRAHLTVNVLGWVSLTIGGTFVTLLPTVLRIRMPSWQGSATAAALAGGVGAAALGMALDIEALAGAGGVVYALGAMGLLRLVVRAARTPRTWPVPITAKHFLAAGAWFLGGTLALATALLRGAAAFDAFGQVYLVVFVGGWIVQTLLGAWLYLLPMSRPGHPDDRRRSLAGAELGGRLQLVALNAGLVLMVLRAGGWVPDVLGAVGVGLALGGAALALLKAWAFNLLGRTPALSDRLLAVWGAAPSGRDRAAGPPGLAG
jgi:nitrite reductase (NO-forming)